MNRMGVLVLFAAGVAAAGEPRGLEVKSTVELATQLDSRFAEWLKGKGDRKTLLATRAEVEANLKPLTLDAAELKKFTNEAMGEQKLGKLPKKFTPAKALVDALDGVSPQLIFIEAQGSMACAVKLYPLPDKRLVLASGPVCMDAPIEKLLQNSKQTYLEKKDGAWVEAERPAAATP